ncbi:MAG: RNA polymerase sigma factor [Xanthomonadales bacterium]|nr:RNA polymerase sigma factor [Xanthomonadales bacterium]
MPASAQESSARTDPRRREMDAFLRGVERRAFLMAKYATRNPDDALELVQEAMLGFVRHYAGKPAAEWSALFFTVLESRLNDWRRRQQVRSRYWWFGSRDRVDDEDVFDPVAEAVDESAFTPLERLCGERAGAALTQALTQLSDRQRQAFLYRLWEGFDVAQTAAVMGCSEGSVKTHLHRALGQLRLALEDWR